jgi:hypothetical protein
MPYSPFTRFLACVLVALVLLGLLWPDDRAHEWAWHGTGAMAVLLAIFTWSAVKNAPPLDDRAFQLCLPPGPNRAFFRIVWIHVLVLAGVSFAVLVYCVLWNFGWRSMSWGVAMLTIPAWALMSIVGVACSAGSSQQHWKSMAWIAIFAPPVFSGGLLYVLIQDMEKYVPEAVYFTPLRTMVLTAATLYPLVWWLIAVRKRRNLGLLLGGATSALLPWLLQYGDFVKAPQKREIDWSKRATLSAPITLTRKPVAENSERWLPVEDMLEVNGLAEGEHIGVALGVRRPAELKYNPNGVPGWDGMPIFEIRDEAHPDNNGIRYSEAMASNRGGRIVWGTAAVNERIRELVPPVESFEYWESSMNRPVSSPVIANPMHPDFQPPAETEERKPFSYRWLTKDSFQSQPWLAWLVAPASWKLVGSCPAVEGTSIRPESGGVLKIFPIAQDDGENYQLSFRYYFEHLWMKDGPWFGDDFPDDWSGMDIAVVAIDETGKRAYLFDRFNHRRTENVMLGHYEQYSCDVGPADTSAKLQRIEMLRKCRLYVLMRQISGPFREVELPKP